MVTLVRPAIVAVKSAGGTRQPVISLLLSHLFPLADPRLSIYNSGSSNSFCGNGCQSSFGSCGSLSPPPPHGSCGSPQNVTCGNGLRCSKWGYWYASLVVFSLLFPPFLQRYSSFNNLSFYAPTVEGRRFPFL